MEKLVIGVIIVLVLLWLITLPGRRRRRDDAPDRQRRKMHSSRMVGHKGFEVSIAGEGHRVVHAKQRAGKRACSDQCPYCAMGQEYQATKLRVFDDRLVRGRKDRRRMRRGDVDYEDE